VLGGGVDEIPVVDELRVGQIEVVDSAFPRLVFAAEGIDEQQERKQTLLVSVGAEQRRRITDACSSAVAAELAELRHADADEPIAFRVLTLACFEETLEDGNARGIRKRPHSLTQGSSVTAHTIRAVRTRTP
jgi:hypothetical protein